MSGDDRAVLEALLRHTWRLYLSEKFPTLAGRNLSKAEGLGVPLRPSTLPVELCLSHLTPWGLSGLVYEMGEIDSFLSATAF